MGQFSKEQKIQRGVHSTSHYPVVNIYNLSNTNAFFGSEPKPPLTKAQQARKDERDAKIDNRKFIDFKARQKENKENNMTPASRPFRASR